MTTTAASRPEPATELILSMRNIEVVYNDVVLVLHGISLDVPREGIVALLGANGAGKSTTLKAISGLLKSEDGEITRGDVVFAGEKITGLAPDLIVKRGIFQVMEGRRIIEDMTVIENLRMGAYSRPGRFSNDDIDKVFNYFPGLKERRGLAGYLSGGEQQMLAIGRALMAHPKLILMDEPSMGLAPKVVQEVFGIINKVSREQKIPILLVEQNSNLALQYADFGYIMELGKIVLEGTREELVANEDVREFYLGLGQGEARRSFKNLKTYKRRKRWL